MKTIVLLVALSLLLPASAAAEENTAVSMSVSVPAGPFTATLAFDSGIAVLTVDDPTGSGRGWWVTLDCTCRRLERGDLRVLAGDEEHAPRWVGSTLIAEPGEGAGLYRQTFLATPGSWVVTSGQGQYP